MAGEIVLTEPFDSGLVTARDPSTLSPGEMARCNNTVYKPNDDAIWKAPGRTVYNSTPVAAPLKGLRVLGFDDLTYPWVIGYHGSTIAKSEMASETQNFTAVSAAQGSGATLDSVFYDNRHYLLKGVGATDGDALEGPNLAVKSNGIATPPGGDLIFRRHGLAAVVSSPTAAVNGPGPGYGWPITTTFPAAWYFFITTEVHDMDGPDELESAFEGTPAAAKIMAANQGVLITFPPLVNDGLESNGAALINGRRVYMSTAHGTQPDGSVDSTQPPFPSLDDYAQIAQVAYAAGQTTIIAQAGTSVGPKFPGAEANITSTWTSLTNDRADDNLPTVTSTSGAKYVAYTFGFLGITGLISGVSVEIKWRATASPLTDPQYNGITVGLTKTGGGANTLVGLTQIANAKTGGTGNFRIANLGGPQDQWGTSWAIGDFNGATTFGVLVTAALSSTFTMSIDYIKVWVWTGVLQYGKPYPTISIIVGDEIITESANSEPPVASTGDVFESQMVVNEVARKAVMRYSIPDKVEYFPKDYYLQFSSKEQDIVTCIRKLGNKLIVGLKHQLYRVNYLPRQLDAEFDRGRAVEALSETHGIIGTQAATLFSPPDKPQMLAYVSSQGIHATDGYQTTTLSEDLDWQNTVAQAYLHNCVLVNYPKLYSLVLYYTPSGVETNVQALWLNYHPSHIKTNGKLLVSGPNDVRAISSHLAKKDNEWVLFTGHLSDGKAYIEDRGWDSEDALSRGPVDILSRTIYPAGIGYESTIERVWYRHSDSLPVITWTSQLYVQNTDGAPTLPTDWFTDTFATTYKTLSRLDAMHTLGEAFLINTTTPDLGASGNSGGSLSYMAIEVGGHGLQDNPSA